MSDNGNPGYSIKAVSEATGLTVETLRAWERRYGVIQPQRDDSGRRIYSTHDVSRLLRLREITARGHQIGKVADLSNEDLSCLLSDTQPQSRADEASQMLVERILCAAEHYRPAECDQVIALAFALLPVADVVRDVLSPALREIGERWHRGEFTIAQERIASSAARRQLTTLLNTFNSVSKGPVVVFATVSGEQHELGILMHAALAASHMLRVCYLGADLPADEISNCAKRVDASAVAVSLVMASRLKKSLAQLRLLRRHLPPAVKIWVGGGAAAGIDAGQLPAGSVHMVESEDFEQEVRMLAAR